MVENEFLYTDFASTVATLMDKITRVTYNTIIIQSPSLLLLVKLCLEQRLKTIFTLVKNTLQNISALL